MTKNRATLSFTLVLVFARNTFENFGFTILQPNIFSRPSTVEDSTAEDRRALLDSTSEDNPPPYAESSLDDENSNVA